MWEVISEEDVGKYIAGKLITLVEVDKRKRMFPLSLGDIVHSIPAPDDPADLTWDGMYLWMVSEQSAQLYKLDPSDGSILAQFNLPSYGESDPNAWGLTWDGTYLWHSDYGDGATIYKLNPANGEIVSSFPSPASGGLGLAWDGNYLWLADCWEDVILKLDPSDGSVLASIPAPGTHCIGLTYEEGYLWTADYDGQTAYKLNPSDGSVVQSFTTPTSFPKGLTFDGTYIWNAGGSMLYQIDIEHVEGVDWLSYDPSSGTVPPAGSEDVNVGFNTVVGGDTLAVGDYYANIIITSNDPDPEENPNIVAVHLKVTPPGVPDVEVTPPSFEVTLRQGENLDTTMVIANVGDGTLTFEITDKVAQMKGAVSSKGKSQTNTKRVTEKSFYTPTNPEEGIDVATGLPVSVGEHNDLEPKIASAGGSILWDLTHGVYLDYQPSGRFSSLTALLQSSGYTMETTDVGVDNVDLSRYDVLVVCLGSAHNSIYTSCLLYTSPSPRD